jgi:uncharacterized protein (TIGR02099 family)
MIRLFKSAAARTLSLTLLALVVGAALLGAVRLAVPFAEHLRAPVQALIAETLGMDAEIGGLGLRLVGWAPRISLSDTRLIDSQSGRTQLSLKALDLDLDPAASLRARAPKIASLTLVGAHLVVRRHADGRWLVAGLEGFTAGGNEAMTFFLGNGRFQLADSDVYLVDEGQGAPAVHLAEVAMRFDNSGVRHRIGLQARIFGDRETQVRLAADLTGPPGEPAHWQGPAYLHWQGKDLGPVLDGRLPRGLHLGSALADIETWGELADGALAEVLTRFELRGLVAWREDRDGSAAPVHLQRLTGRLQWGRLEDGWRLEANELQVTRRGATTPAASAGLRVSRDTDGDWSASGSLSQLDLGLVRDLLSLLPDPPAALAQLRAARLAGTADEIEGRYQSGEHPSWLVQSRLSGLSLAPVGRIAGVRGLAGELSASEAGGTFALDAAGLSVELPALLRGHIGIERAAGRVDWEHAADGGLRLHSEDLAAVNADLRTRSRVELVLPAGGAKPLLDLQTDFSGADARAVSDYLPVGLLKPNLVRWLDRAFVAGRVSEGTLIFRGVPADFPFRDADGRFLVDFSVVDGVLDYRAGWPLIAGLAAQVRFDGTSLTIEATSARLLDSDLHDVRAEIPDLMDRETRALRIQGRAEGPFADALRVLRETPLAERFGALAAPFEASGRARFDLADLTIPLRPHGDGVGVALDSVLSWPEPATLGLPRWGIDLEGLAGELGITHHGLSGEAIAARLWDGPVEIRVGSEPAPGQAGRRTQVRVHGRHGSTTLAQQLPSPLWDLVRGASRWSLDIGVPGADLGTSDPGLELVLSSDLRGAAIDLPAPLGKAAGDSRALRLTARPSAERGLDLSGAYGELGIALAFAARPEGGLRPAAATLHFGGRAQIDSRADGLRLTGTIDDLDLSAWLNWWDRRPLGAKPDAALALSLRAVDLRVRRVLLSDLVLHDLRLDLGSERGGWRGELEARELAGTLSLPARARESPIEVRLARLDLKGLLGERGGPGAGRERGGKAADPRRASTLDLRIERLLWGDALIGALTLDSERRPDGVALTGLALDGPLLVMRGRGTWTSEGGEQRSALKLTTEASDMGAFLRLIEFKSQLDEAPANATLDLTWPGGPSDFSPAILRGRATAEVGAGSLLDVEPGVGRMLGILNLAALQRRLSLDFRDLFDRGYAFEQISGALAVEDGKARIERLTIDGPSASITVEGETDLIDQRFDQVVTVTPRLGSSLAVASAVAAGPLVGAAVYLADKVTGGAVDRIGRHQYSVSGPWEDPEIRPLGATVEVAPPETPPVAPPSGSEAPEAPSAPPSDLGPFFDSR